jgi:hypothetical protein
MHKLNFPEYKFKITKDGSTYFILDEIRKKRLVLTPEEWVRQHLIQYLINEKDFPKGLISLEAGLKINSLQKRYDILIYNKTRMPQVLVECKAPTIKINENVFQQILIYNAKIKAPFLLISNGINHYFLKKNKEGKYSFLPDIPKYDDLSVSID